MKIWTDHNYRVETETVETRKGTWNTLLVKIFNGTLQIGEYTRNYSSLYNTFHPFQQNGKDYALYSKDYTSTRVMNLPDCMDLGGEDPAMFGFCPTGYAVPAPDVCWYDDNRPIEEENVFFNGSIGFVCGCVWGDDTSWKIQLMDLRGPSIKRLPDLLGYVELMGGAERLSESVDIEDWPTIRVAALHWIRADMQL